MKIIQIGSGGWAQGWLQFIHEDPDCELAALVSRGGPNLEAAAEKWGIPQEKCFTDLEEALKLECDLVIVAVPHKLHLVYGKRAVEAGKNVLIEKPFCDDLQEAVQFVKFMEGRVQKAWVSQNYRFRQEFWRIKASLGQDQGLIGTPAWADVVFRLGTSTLKNDPETAWQRASWRKTQTNLLLIEICIHHFDMMRFLVDSDVKSVYARAWTPDWSDLEGDQAAMMILEFENGFRVNYSASTKSIGYETGYQCNWMLQTDRGAVRWEFDTQAQFQGARNENVSLKEEYDFPGFDRGGVLKEMKKEIIGLEGSVPTVADNLKSLAISFAACKSIQEARTVYLREIIEWRSL